MATALWIAIGSLTPAFSTWTWPKVERDPDRLRSSEMADFPSFFSRATFEMPAVGLEIAETDDDGDGHAVDRDQLQLEALASSSAAGDRS